MRSDPDEKTFSPQAPEEAYVPQYFTCGIAAYCHSFSLPSFVGFAQRVVRRALSIHNFMAQIRRRGP